MKRKKTVLIGFTKPERPKNPHGKIPDDVELVSTVQAEGLCAKKRRNVGQVVVYNAAVGNDLIGTLNRIYGGRVRVISSLKKLDDFVSVSVIDFLTPAQPVLYCSPVAEKKLGNSSSCGASSSGRW